MIHLLIHVNRLFRTLPHIVHKMDESSALWVLLMVIVGPGNPVPPLDKDYTDIVSSLFLSLYCGVSPFNAIRIQHLSVVAIGLQRSIQQFEPQAGTLAPMLDFDFRVQAIRCLLDCILPSKKKQAFLIALQSLGVGYFDSCSVIGDRCLANTTDFTDSEFVLVRALGTVCQEMGVSVSSLHPNLPVVPVPLSSTNSAIVLVNLFVHLKGLDVVRVLTMMKSFGYTELKSFGDALFLGLISDTLTYLCFQKCLALAKLMMNTSIPLPTLDAVLDIFSSKGLDFKTSLRDLFQQFIPNIEDQQDLVWSLTRLGLENLDTVNRSIIQKLDCLASNRQKVIFECIAALAKDTSFPLWQLSSPINSHGPHETFDSIESSAIANELLHVTAAVGYGIAPPKADYVLRMTFEEEYVRKMLVDSNKDLFPVDFATDPQHETHSDDHQIILTKLRWIEALKSSSKSVANHLRKVCLFFFFEVPVSLFSFFQCVYIHVCVCAQIDETP